MKKFLILAVLVVFAGFLAACATLPAPRSAQDSLVVGRLVLDFPNGFFDQSPRIVGSDILLHFYLPAEHRHVSVLTSNGYFRFRTRGTGEVILTGYDFSRRGYRAFYQLSDRFTERFTTKPHEVVYLGQITVNYTDPRRVDRVGIGYESYGAQARIGSRMGESRVQSYWDFARSINHSWDKQKVIGYLQKNPHSPWLSYQIFRGS
jgi:hypothetical protein